MARPVRRTDFPDSLGAWRSRVEGKLGTVWRPAQGGAKVGVTAIARGVEQADAAAVLGATVTDLQATVAGLQTRLGAAEATITDQGDRLTAAEAAITDLQARVAALENPPTTTP